MLILDALAEQRIREAIERGDLDDLPGSGRPLPEEENALVPEALRMAWRVLRNAGFVPPEVEALRELRSLEALVQDLPDGEPRRRAVARLDYLLCKLGTSPGSAIAEYRDRLVARLDADDGGRTAQAAAHGDRAAAPRPADPAG